jgi:hypothetical protein
MSSARGRTPLAAGGISNGPLARGYAAIIDDKVERTGALSLIVVRFVLREHGFGGSELRPF